MSITRNNKIVAWVLAGPGMLVALASILFGWYDIFFWFDEALHAYNFFALTLLIAVYAYDAVLTGGRNHRFFLVLTIAIIGLGLGGLWEIAEFCYDHFIAKPNAILAKIDTIIDMALDTAGALVAGLVLLRMLGE